MMSRRTTRRSCLAIVMVVLALARPEGTRLLAQATPPAVRPAGESPVVAAGPYLHLVSDLDRSLDFYRAVLGTEPGGTADTRAWGHNEPVAVMYGVPGAEIRTATLPVPGSDVAVELVAFRGVDRPSVSPRVSDPGAALLLLFVRDLEAATAAALSHGGAVLTPGGAVVRGRNRFVIVRDPDGFYVELLQTDPPQAGATTGNVVAARFRTTANDIERTAAFYREVFGVALPALRPVGDDATLGAMTGLGVARTRLAIGAVPNTSAGFEIVEFQGIARTRTRASVHGVGASMFRFRVRDIEAVFARARQAGATPVTPTPVTLKDNRRMVIVEDLDGLFVQIWQSAPGQ